MSWYHLVSPELGVSWHHQVSQPELYLNVFQLQHDLNSGGRGCDVDGTYGRHQGVLQHIQIKPFSQENSFFAAECSFAFGGKYSIFIITLPMKVKCARYWPKTGKAIFSDTEVSITMLNAVSFVIIMFNYDGILQVSLQSEEESDHYTLRSLEVAKDLHSVQFSKDFHSVQFWKDLHSVQFSKDLHSLIFKFPSKVAHGEETPREVLQIQVFLYTFWSKNIANCDCLFLLKDSSLKKCLIPSLMCIKPFLHFSQRWKVGATTQFQRAPKLCSPWSAKWKRSGVND